LHSQWYKTTPGHNTVTIGTKNQRRTTGKLLAFHSDEHSAATAVESTGAYPSWRLRRQLLLTDEFVVDVFDVQGDRPDTVDWFLRSQGEASTSLTLSADDTKPETATYGYLKEKRSASTNDTWQCRWQVPKGVLLLTMVASPDTQVTLAQAPGPAGRDPWDTLRVRRQTANTRFVAVYQFLTAEAKAQPVRMVGPTLQIGPTSVALPTDEAPLPQLVEE
jgi:hypothetical protein